MNDNFVTASCSRGKNIPVYTRGAKTTEDKIDCIAATAINFSNFGDKQTFFELMFVATFVEPESDKESHV